MAALRILVADDDDAVRTALARMVESLGHQVVAEARDGRETVDLTEITSPDLLILDIRMPHMDGLQAARAITEKAVLPIVIVTAHSDQHLIEEASEVGVFSYLVKPMTTDRLAAAIATAEARFQDLQRALESRKLVERAKGIIMRDMSVGEQDAYRWLKRTSSRSNQKVGEVARRIVALDTSPRK